jgi:protein-L-isoaspartate(D-aspartate) O-methyltransferase
MNIEQARFNMIEQQVKPWKVFDEKLLSVMSILPREQFVSPDQLGLSYADTHLSLGNNQAMLAPREIARLIQALQLTEQDKVLEIGTGSGYSSAVLSKLSKHVFSVDIIADFVKSAKKIHKKLALPNITVEEGDACDGWMAHAPYHAILITAALPTLSTSLKRNLTKNGKVVCLLEKDGGHVATLAQLDESDEWQYEYLFPVAPTRMINAERTNQFVF